MGFSLRFLCGLLLIPAFTFAQTSFYSRFEGQIGPMHAIMHLNRMQSDAEASLYLFVPQDEKTVKQYTLVGNVDNDSQISLHEPADTVEIFVGRLSPNRLEGAWQAENGMMQMALFKAQYPAGSTRLNLHVKEATIRLNEKQDDSPEASFGMKLLWPENSQDTALSQLFYSWLMQTNDTITGLELTASMILETELQRFSASYQQLSGATNTDSPTFYWIKSEQQQVLVNEFDLLCIERASYAFTGGAHGIENFRYLLIDRLENRVLTRENLFLPQSDSLLNSLITKTFREDQKVPSDQSLTAFGLFVDTIEANDNIFINYKGIGFYFNSYEIAPYSFGQSSVLIPFGELLPLMTALGKEVAARIGEANLQKKLTE